MPGYVASRPSGNAVAGSAAAGSVRSLTTPRARAIWRPATPITTAAAVITPTPMSTPRRLAAGPDDRRPLGSSTGVDRTSHARAATPTTPATSAGRTSARPAVGRLRAAAPARAT